MDLSNVGIVIYRGLVSLVTLFLVTKVIGKKQVSELSLFDYVIGISIGNFAAEMTINTDSPEMHGILAVVLFGAIAYFVSWITMKNMTLRRFFIGTPTIIIQDGKLLRKNMQKVRVDVNDLLQECRLKGFFDISQIAYALMESNGEMSILPKANYQPLTPNTTNLKVKKEQLIGNVVIDGKIMTHNLHLFNKDESWLKKELAIKGYKDLNKILLCTMDSDYKVTIYENNKNIAVLDILE